MNESPGVSYQQCHMFPVMLLQQYRPSRGGGRLEKNSDISGRHTSTSTGRAQSEQSQLPSNYPVSMEIQVQVEQQHGDQPHSDLQPWQDQNGFVGVFSSFQLRMTLNLQLDLCAL